MVGIPETIMNMNESGTMWTIGHSTRTLEEFLALLKSFQISLLVDIRSLPGSRAFPHYNKESLELSLPASGIQYLHMKELGGRRKVNPNSKNTAWRLPAFRGYADYMETEDFKKAIKELEEMAMKQRTVYMCAEAVWWRCHRSMVSDWLKFHGWKVMHILGKGKSEEHPYTQPARIVEGELVYHELPG